MSLEGISRVDSSDGLEPPESRAASVEWPVGGGAIDSHGCVERIRVIDSHELCTLAHVRETM